MVNTIRVIGLDRKAADSSAVKRWEGDRTEGVIESSDNSDLESSSPCQSAQTCLGRLSEQEGQVGRQESSQMPMGRSEHECAPLLCRLRMNFRDQDSSNIVLQDYRCIVTIIRQEDVDLDVHDNCSSLPCVCVAQAVTCLGIRRVARTRRQNRNRLPPRGPSAKLMIGQKRTRRRNVQSGIRRSLKLYSLLPLVQPRHRLEAETLHLIHPQNQKTAKKTDKSTSALKPQPWRLAIHLLHRQRLLFGRDLRN